jgi:tyrosine-protein phosphatase YwqE
VGETNLAVVVDYFGESITKVAEKLLHQGMYNFFWSDVDFKNQFFSI